MIPVITSISPSHKLGAHHQAQCTQSWIDHGYTVISVNSAKEPRPDAPAQYITTEHDGAHIAGKPYVMLSDILSVAQAHEVCIITNSDIELRDPHNALAPYIAKASEGLVIANRSDHNGDHNGKVYPYGFDLFILHRKYIDLLPPSLFCIGQTWWDYWLPWRMIRSNVPLFKIREPILWHQRHEQQHSGLQWAKMTDHFTWLEGVHRGQKPQYVTGKIFNEITRHAK